VLVGVRARAGGSGGQHVDVRIYRAVGSYAQVRDNKEMTMNDQENESTAAAQETAGGMMPSGGAIRIRWPCRYGSRIGMQ